MTKQLPTYLLQTLFYGLMLLFTSCASEAEKQERQENSFDLSGWYKTSPVTGSKISMSFEIKNQHGRHDIVVYLDRISQPSLGEINFLKQSNIDHQVVFSHFGTSLILGQDDSSKHLDGGDNISTDFGATSEYHVCSRAFQYNKEYKIEYCLAGTAHKKQKTMTGHLSLAWTRTQKTPATKEGDEDKTVITFGNYKHDYSVDMSRTFYKQYLGNWSGEVYKIDESINDSTFSRIRISESINGQFSSQLSALEIIKYKNDTFKYNENLSSAPLDQLKVADFPAVHIVYSNVNNPASRLVIFAEIWGLGQLTGQVVLIDKENELPLATIKLKKD